MSTSHSPVTGESSDPVPVDGLLDGKVAIVTGAARGIGAATAAHLAVLGARVAVTDRDRDGALAVAAELVAAGHEAIGLTCDVSDAAAVAAMVGDVETRFGWVDLLDHNAAWTDFRTDLDAEEVDLATWDRVLATNATGGLLLVRAVLPRMQARGGGAIVLISSGSASIGEHRRVAYGVSKAAVEQLGRHVAARYGQDGIRCNVVAPGFILTETAARGVSEAGRARLAGQNPLGRLGTPEDIAHVVGFLLSDRAGFVNGQVIRVDGGLTISPRLAGLD
jgi:NAD(P)-dependent dehydrogenase (short-subunit alcohol dehydrogenase family)